MEPTPPEKRFFYVYVPPLWQSLEYNNVICFLCRLCSPGYAGYAKREIIIFLFRMNYESHMNIHLIAEISNSRNTFIGQMKLVVVI